MSDERPVEHDDRTGTERVEALARYAILDTEPESGYDDIVLLASQLCDTPVALISLVAEDRQWFKARHGLEASETPLNQSVCAYALRSQGVFVIPDLAIDPRTMANPLVTADPFIRFYAGAVLTTPEGVPLGTLCIIDTKPRPDGLTKAQNEALQALARQVMAQMELRRALARRDEALAESRASQAAFERQQEFLGHELSHRLKNILAVVQAVVAQTLRNATSVDAARKTLSGRIIALGKAHEILFADGAEGAGMATVIQRAINLHDDGLEPRFRLRGPEVEIGAKAALSLALMMHELATNAMKYGALSVPGGSVDIDWALTTSAEPLLTLSWCESGGPAITPPTRKGFGTRLIEQALAGSVGGTVVLNYPVTGLECRLTAPLAGFYAPEELRNRPRERSLNAGRPAEP